MYIIKHSPPSIPTKEQMAKLSSLESRGYKWNKELSYAYCAVVMKKGNDLWVFGLEGQIDHNPEISLSTKI